MSDEYLSKEEIKKWRSSVEKITLEEYAARLGKKLQEEKQTNDLADMLYSHYNPNQSFDTYNTVTKLEKIDLTPKTTASKQKSSVKVKFDDFENDDMDGDNLNLDISLDNEEQALLKKIKEDKESVKKESSAKKSAKQKADQVEALQETKTKTSKKGVSDDIKGKAVKDNKEDKKVDKKVSDTSKKAGAKQVIAKNKTSPAKKGKSKTNTTSSLDVSSLNISFIKPLTDREEKVLSYFIENRGEIVYAKDLAELLELKRDYIYKYIKNLRSKMSTDIIANADNGGFKLN